MNDVVANIERLCARTFDRAIRIDATLAPGHGGAIRVESSPGAGAQFDLYLPAVPADRARAVRPQAVPRPPVGVETVLIVDDEVELRRAMERSLRSLGYTVIVAENGREGVERFREHAASIATVLRDVVMPEMGGVEAFRHIRAIRPTVPVLVCSGYTAASAVQEILDAGANGFLAKPFDTFELAQALRDLLDRVGRDRASPT